MYGSAPELLSGFVNVVVAACAPGATTAAPTRPFRPSPILDGAVRALFRTVLLFSVVVLLVGHDEPGGGFIGGLVAGAAFMLLFLAPVYVPRDLLRGWIADVAPYDPATALLEAGRGFISGEPEHGLSALLVALGLLLALTVYAVRGLRRAEAGV